MLSNNIICLTLRAAVQYVLLFRNGSIILTRFQTYVVTCSYSSRPFLCALGTSYSTFALRLYWREGFFQVAWNSFSNFDGALKLSQMDDEP